MGNINSTLTMSLIDNVSKPARTLAQALTDVEKSEKAVAKALSGTNLDGGFQKKLANMKASAKELEQVNKMWREFAVQNKLSRSPSYWTADDLSKIKTWKSGVISSLREVRREETAFQRSIARVASQGMSPVTAAMSAAGAGRYERLLLNDRIRAGMSGAGLATMSARTPNRGSIDYGALGSMVGLYAGIQAQQFARNAVDVYRE